MILRPSLTFALNVLSSFHVNYIFILKCVRYDLCNVWRYELDINISHSHFFIYIKSYYPIILVI